LYFNCKNTTTRRDLQAGFNINYGKMVKNGEGGREIFADAYIFPDTA